MDFSNSVILPREDFVELQEAAWNAPDLTTKDRVANSVQAFVYCAFGAGMIAAGTWGWATAVEWHEKKASERRLREAELAKKATQQ